MTTVGQCRGTLSANPSFDPGLAAYDLSRSGTPFAFSGAATIKEQAAYVQDEVAAGNASFKLGLRFDHYDGLTTKSLVQPRLGVSDAVPGGGPPLIAGSSTRTLSHTQALLFGPELGGLRFSADYAPVAQPDHDEPFQANTHLDYRSRRPLGFWAGLTWRDDSGLVAVAVPAYQAALRLTGDEPAAIGLYCGSIVATRSQPLRSTDVRRHAHHDSGFRHGERRDQSSPHRAAPAVRPVGWPGQADDCGRAHTRRAGSAPAREHQHDQRRGPITRRGPSDDRSGSSYSQAAFF